MTSRITVVLHQNPSYVTISLNDRLFNKERYSFSRAAQAVGSEKEMLDVLNNCTVGIKSAETGKNELKLELSEGMFIHEVIPAVLIAIKHFVNDPTYQPTVYCNDKRWEVEPEEDDDGFPRKPGVKVPPKSVNIGVEYVVFA